MKKWNYKDFKKGMGIITKIPGDEHYGKQNIRPGIVIKSHPKYITVQLLSSQQSDYDYASFSINNKTQYVRSIYLKNITLAQIRGVWIDYNNKTIKLNPDKKIMKTIEKNPYKASAITISLNEYLYKENNLEIIQSELKLVKQENEKLKQENESLKQEVKNKIENYSTELDLEK